MNFDDYESLPTTNVSTNMSAGALAGVLEHVVMYPLDSVKVSMTFYFDVTSVISLTLVCDLSKIQRKK